MNQTFEYLVLIAGVIILSFYAWSQLNHLLLDVAARAASMITGGF